MSVFDRRDRIVEYTTEYLLVEHLVSRFYTKQNNGNKVVILSMAITMVMAVEFNLDSFVK